jgi:hypothetical protein
MKRVGSEDKRQGFPKQLYFTALSQPGCRQSRFKKKGSFVFKLKTRVKSISIFIWNFGS